MFRRSLRRFSLPQALRPARRRVKRRKTRSLEILEDRWVMAAAVLAPIADLTIDADQGDATFDLSAHLQDTAIDGTITRWTTSEGTFYVELFDEITPQTVDSFLDYVAADAYNGDSQGDTFFHRAMAGFIVQGGGFRWDGLDDNTIAQQAPVPNEFTELKDAFENAPINVRGTLAMAKVSAPVDGGPLTGGPNSATTQWFFNLGDNSGNLDNQNGGFTTFGQVLGDGMQIVDAIAALPTENLVGELNNGALTDVPVSDEYVEDSPVETSNLVRITDISVIPELTFEVIANSNSDLVTTSIVDGRLTLEHQGDAAGSATITVRGTDYQGNRVEDTFVVTYDAAGNQAPTLQQALPDHNVDEATLHQNFSRLLPGYFVDADNGDSLTYKVVSNSNPRLVHASIEGANLLTSVRATQHGEATLVIRATDESGLFVEDMVQVNVSPENSIPVVVATYNFSPYPEDYEPQPQDHFPFIPFTIDTFLFSDSDLFTNPASAGNTLTISLLNNSNPELIGTTFDGRLLTFEALPDANGSATITLRAIDQHGAFADHQLSLSIYAINDAPSFMIDSDDIAVAGSSRTVAGWASEISAGAPDEQGQELNFQIVNNSNEALFTTLPTIDSNGALSYELAPGVIGSADVTVRLTDDGGTANGGDDASDTQTFSITSVNINPWRNTGAPLDVNGDGEINGFDALAIINEVRNPFYTQADPQQLRLSRSSIQAPYFDVDGVVENGRYVVTEADAMMIVEALREDPPLAAAQTGSGLTGYHTTAPTSDGTLRDFSISLGSTSSMFVSATPSQPTFEIATGEIAFLPESEPDVQAAEEHDLLVFGDEDEPETPPSELDKSSHDALFAGLLWD